MSVDVEDYFQVSAFEPYIQRSDWSRIPCRVENNVDVILELFDRHRVKSTFFTLGWIAERYPSMVRRIVAEGHELASHGCEHIRATTQERNEFFQDVKKSREILEDTASVAVKGYRAASYSITSENLWAHDVLAEAGYVYSSSIVPVKHDLYGIPAAPRFAHTVAGGRLTEIPVTTVSLLNRRINCGGGGWFRLFPYAFSKWALGKVNRAEGQPAIFYFHPWEVDPEQPRIANVSHKTRFRHYLNLARTHSRLDHLLSDFRWGRVDQVFLKRDVNISS
ncbi:MAG: polysaccharide deacetylase family protein [Porticoccaceae bacterium]|nr:polysaccharide deacetylase family protein [Porticoccaceae bacterium]